MKYFVFLKRIEQQKFDNALASAKDQMVQNVQVVCVLFLLTVSLNLNTAAPKNVSPPPNLLKLSVIVLYDTGSVFNGLLFFSDPTVIVSRSNHMTPPVSAQDTTSLEKKASSRLLCHAGKDKFLYIRP